MFRPQQACGSWQSDITAEMVAGSSVRYADVQLDGSDIYWLEGRPQEQGRNVIVRRRQGEPEDILPAPYSARSRVHEYGGGAYVVNKGDVWFVNNADQQVYVLRAGGVHQLTDQAGYYFADLQVDPQHDCLYAIRENHTDETRHEPLNELVMITDREVSVVASGDDFYASPALSHDGRHLAWLSWNHPDMPWDSTTLWLAAVEDDGHVLSPCKVVSEKNQSVFQPSWSADGHLYFINDPQGWWQLYRLNDVNDMQSIQRVCQLEAEMGRAQWQFGMRSYVFEDNNRIIATACDQGIWQLLKVCTRSGDVEPIVTPFSSFESLAANKHIVALIAAGKTRGDEVVTINLRSEQIVSCLADHDSPIDVAWISAAQEITFATSNNDVAHGFYYPPHNPHIDLQEAELPPLLVMTHGGPTGSTNASLNLRTQFWTSRGFAVLDVNYRGSTGYGRAYREKLKGHWGIYDVDDVVSGAQYLAKKNRVDAKRLAIRGGSAGGFTTLAALTFTDIFAAGASYYGIGDLQLLAEDTHKFEARYLDRLVGEFPRDKALYEERSPLNHVEQLSCPVIFMQGEEDKVVPPEQAQRMVAALQEKGVSVELYMFAGEQHGFRQAETIIKTLQAELAFYARVFNFGEVARIGP